MTGSIVILFQVPTNVPSVFSHISYIPLLVVSFGLECNISVPIPTRSFLNAEMLGTQVAQNPTTLLVH